MKKVWLSISAVLILIVAGVSVYIASIDWNQHKDKIAEQFSEMTGKVVSFDGPVSLVLLPSPHLEASNVMIYNPDSIAGKPLMKIPSLVASLSLMPLVHGNLDVKRMALVEPTIEVEIDEQGELNWKSELSSSQEEVLQSTQVTLNSVTIEKARVNFLDLRSDANVALENLNAEVIAQSLSGPYRIEGSYVRENNPEGFAISIGQLSRSFATSLNVVLTHPASKSFLRFDGTFLMQNASVNGNVIFETEKLMNFVTNNFKSIKLEQQYDYPLALSFELNSNRIKLDLASIVLKYGETTGAGNILIPYGKESYEYEDFMKSKEERKRVEIAFDLTNIDLNPLIYTIQNLVEKYKSEGAEYQPDYKFDVIGDIKAVKASYNGQNLKDLSLSFDFINNDFNINEFKAGLPGETEFALNGEVYSNEGEFAYDVETKFSSDNFLRTLNWLKINPVLSAVSTYKKAVGSAKLAGNFQKIQVSPFELTIDKSSVSGELGIKLGQRNDALLILKADMINFDNYIAALPKEEQEKDFAQKMVYRFSKLGFLKDFDMQVMANLDLGIYENLPFERSQFNATLLNGTLEIEKLQIDNVANTSFEMSGLVKGFGETPSFENLKYALDTKDLSAFLNKMEYKSPNIDFSQMKKFESKGIMTGGLDRFAIKATSKLENFEFVYGGQVSKKDEMYNLQGNLEAKHPDFVKMLNEFNVKYKPRAFSLGLFNLKTKISGNEKMWRANPLKINIGFNEFDGNLNFDNTTGRPNFVTDLKVNKFEVNRFFYNDAMVDENKKIFDSQKGDEADFLLRPNFDKTKFNYAFYSGFDLSGKFVVDDLSYGKWSFANSTMDLTLINSIFNMSNFKAKYHGGVVNSNFELRISGTPMLNGGIETLGIKVKDSLWGGKKYALIDGVADTKFSFSGNAASEDDIVNTLNGTLDFSINNAEVKGWAMETIYADIVSREKSDGLAAFVRDNLQGGNTKFNLIKGSLVFDKGEYSLNAVTMKASNLNVGVGGGGSLANWDVSVSANVKYDEPKFLPNYIFAYNGLMSNPSLVVDVDALTNLYNNRIAKIVEREKQIEEDNLKRLQMLMGNQRKVAQVLKDELQNSVLEEIKSKKNASSNILIKSKYSEIEKKANQAIDSVDEALTISMTPKFDEALIEEVKVKTTAQTPMVEKLKKEIISNHKQDLKIKLKDARDEIVKIYNGGKKFIFDFNSNKEAYNTRLASIITEYKIENDAVSQGKVEKINELGKLVEDVSLEASKKYEVVSKNEDIAEMEAYIQELQTTYSKVLQEAEALKKGLEEYALYLDEKIGMEEKAYNDRIREEEVQRKLEENKGKISIKKTGKSLEVTRDIQEIEEMEEKTSKEEVKVLDFSNRKNANRVQNQEVAPKVGVVRKELREKTVKSGGVVRK